nr:MAG: hypothetical protein [scractlig virus 1]
MTVRPCPVGIAIEGPSGIGKSSIVAYLLSKVSKELVTRSKRGECDFSDAETWSCWHQNSSDAYDQNYFGQYYHDIDDCFQDATHQDHLRLIQKISTTPCSTYQAELAQKGAAYRARVLMVTCNQFPRNSKTLTHFPALVNRFPVRVQMTFPEDGNGVPIIDDGIRGRNTTDFREDYGWAVITMAGVDGQFAVASIDDIVTNIVDRVIANDEMAEAARAASTRRGKAPGERRVELDADGVHFHRDVESDIDSVYGDAASDVESDGEEPEVQVDEMLDGVGSCHFERSGFDFRKKKSCCLLLKDIMDHPNIELLRRCKIRVTVGELSVMDWLTQYPEMRAPAMFYSNMHLIRSVKGHESGLEWFSAVSVIFVRDQDYTETEVVDGAWYGGAYYGAENPYVFEPRWYEKLTRCGLAKVRHFFEWGNRFLGDNHGFVHKVGILIMSPFYHLAICIAHLLGFESLDGIIGTACAVIGIGVGEGIAVAIFSCMFCAIFRLVSCAMLHWKGYSVSLYWSPKFSEDWKLNEAGQERRCQVDPPMEGPPETAEDVLHVDSYNVSRYWKFGRPCWKWDGGEWSISDNTTCIPCSLPVVVPEVSPGGKEEKRSRARPAAPMAGRQGRRTRFEQKVTSEVSPTDKEGKREKSRPAAPVAGRMRRFVQMEDDSIPRSSESTIVDEHLPVFDIASLFEPGERKLPGKIARHLRALAHELPDIPEPRNPVDVVEDIGVVVGELESYVARRISVQTDEQVKDMNALNVLKSMRDKNLIQVSSKRGQCHGLGTGEWIIFPAHLVRDVGEVVVHLATGKIEIPVVQVVPEWDLASARLPKGVNRFPDIRNNVVSDLSFLTACRRATFVQYYPQTDLTAVLCGTFVKNLEVMTERSGVVVQHDRVVVTGLTVNGALSSYGDCGTPLLAFASALPQKIVGIHVAGSTSGTHSYSTALTVERLNALCSEVEVVEPEVLLRPQRPSKKFSCSQRDQSSAVVEGGFAPASLVNFGEYFLQPEEHSVCKNFIPDTTMTYVGDSCVMASNPSTSELRRTPFVVRGQFPFSEDMKLPSVLVESDPRLTDPESLLKDGTGKPSILLTQLKKFCGPDVVMDEELLQLIVDQLIDYSVAVLDGKQLASHPDNMFWDALNGDSVDSHFQPLAFKSSAGVPWNAIGGTRKIDYLTPKTVKAANGVSTGYWFDNDKPSAKLLYHAAMHKLEMANRGVRTFSIWKDCLKDELRPAEKVAVGKTRAFSSSPFETVIVGRGLFGRYKAAWTAAGGDLFHSVGIDPNSSEWQRLYSDLNVRDSRYIDGDFSNFDGSIPARLMEAAGEVIIETIHRVSPDNFRLARYVVWDEFIHTIQIAGSTVYQKHHGNNSGNPMTTPANCWVNVIAELYCYYMLTGSRSLAKWKADVVFRCFGDDCVRAVSKKCDPRYNPLELVRVYETFGMTFTTATKTSEQRWVTLEEVVYLQRKFKPLTPAVVLAPLVLASVYQCFNYCSLAEHELEGWQGLLGEQLAEAARHGKNFFAFVVGRLKNALNKLPSTAFRREMSTILLTTFDDVYQGVLVKAGADLKREFEKHS